MAFIKDFKDFAVKGNVVDLAVAVIIGAAFGKIITSFVADIVTPLILQPALNAAHLKNIEDLTMMGNVKYGSFLSAIISFIIVALVLFLVIEGITSLKKKEIATPAAPAAISQEEVLLTEIRDLLKNNSLKN
jgi:large conductance mechanosensitive channel